jgi:hypothetical protein
MTENAPLEFGLRLGENGEKFGKSKDSPFAPSRPRFSRGRIEGLFRRKSTVPWQGGGSLAQHTGAVAPRPSVPSAPSADSFFSYCKSQQIAGIAAVEEAAWTTM